MYFALVLEQYLVTHCQDVMLTYTALVQVQQLVDMGFPYDTVSRALLAAGGDQNAALERLLG